MTPTISVVTISFNQGQYLEAAIQSVLDQDYPCLDFIIVDPGSTDGSREIITRYLPRVRAIFEPDSGPPEGLNRGFSHAKGQIFYYLNADDLVMPSAFRFVAEYFQKHPAVDVAIGNGYLIDAFGTATRTIYSYRWNSSAYLLGCSSYLQQATFFRRRIFYDAGKFNENNKICWDGELLLQMDKAGARIMRVDKMLGAFRIHSSSITGSGTNLRKMKAEHSRLYKEYWREQSFIPPLVLYVFYRVLNYLQTPNAFLSSCKHHSKILFIKMIRGLANMKTEDK